LPARHAPVITPDGVIAAHPQPRPNHPAPGEATKALTTDDPAINGLTSTPAQRWLARLSFSLAGLTVVIVLVLAGLKSLAMVAVGLAAAVVSLAAAYVFLSQRGICHLRSSSWRRSR
jgi:hypothetical protein